ncbi:MAG: hypothetical protein RLN87_03055 [Parasphingopyxis sp.]|uniref:hypothetical protein n=1 Tax=Parasphingopyxis sp. TaxID=1920299 RepID=UPI0032EE9BC3
MKSIYTDNYGLLPWVFLAIGGWLIATAMIQLSEGFALWSALGLLIGLSGLWVAFREFRRRKHARDAGRDQKIVRIVDAED